MTEHSTTAAPGASRAWFATCPKGMEQLLAAELGALGASEARETVAGVHFEGPLALGYRACLWSRLANRILLPLAQIAATDADGLYRGLREVDWGGIMSPQQRFAIDFSGESADIRNTRFGAQRSKDAIVDWFQANQGQRPTVDRQKPDLRFNVRLGKQGILLALDMAGGSLHRRGYRLKAGEAPLKENLAAAILLRADWPGMAARGGALIDPMCGSGTLLLEAAMMSADMAPGLGRRHWGFSAWRGHQPRQWEVLLQDARQRAERGLEARLPEIRGYDADPAVVRRAQENVAALGLEKVVRISCKPLSKLKKPTHTDLSTGLLVCNPPYGERLGERASLAYLYRELGECMLREFPGWQAAIFTADAALGRATGLRSHKQYKLWNGALASQVLLFDLADNRLSERRPDEALTAAALADDQPNRKAGAGARAAGSDAATEAGGPEPATGAADTAAEATPAALTAGAEMFANRLRKNRRKLAAWVKREGIEAYRLYDADMPEYAVAVDLYGDHVHVAEYQAPRSVSEAQVEVHREEVRQALPVALGVPPARIVFKTRQRQRGREQYTRQDHRGELLSVREGQARLLVNLTDYLDTGLFLDHRPLRLRLAREAAGQRFLNLFCYTGTATVHAALGGARQTTSVDLSNTYLGWLRKNLAHNGLDENRNRLVRADCQAWLGENRETFDLILLDPPSFSNSRQLADTFDVLRDQVELVHLAMARLAPGGTLYFSNNRRGFKLAPELAAAFHCEDISRQTLDPDFQRNPRIHQCWQIRHSST